MWVLQQSGALVDPECPIRGRGTRLRPAEVHGTRHQRGPWEGDQQERDYCRSHSHLLCRAGAAGGLGPTSGRWGLGSRGTGVTCWGCTESESGVQCVASAEWGEASSPVLRDAGREEAARAGARGANETRTGV